MARMVRVAGENREGPVYLLGQHHAGKLMRQGQAPKREKQVGTLTGSRRPSIRRSDGEYQTLRTLVADAADQRHHTVGLTVVDGTQNDGRRR